MTSQTNHSVREGCRGCLPLSMPDCYGKYDSSYFGQCRYCDLKLKCAGLRPLEVCNGEL